MTTDNALIETYLEKNTENDQKMREAFDLLAETPRGRLRLRVFEKKYLNFLSPKPLNPEDVKAAIGVIESKTGGRHTTKDIHGNLLNEWLQDVAASVGRGDREVLFGVAYYPVDIYDDNDTIVYTVPPLVKSREIDPRISRVIPSIVMDAQDKYSLLPQLGDRTIRENLVPILPKPVIDEETLNAWNKIYQYHGLPLFDQQGNVAASSDSNAAKVDSNGLEIVDDVMEF